MKTPAAAPDLSPHLPWIRAQFPALETAGTALFDNAGGSQTLGRVADAVRDYLLHTNVQLGASYSLSQAAQAAVDAGVRAAESLVGAASGEVVLGPSTTQLVFNLSRAMAQLWQAGDELVLTEADHEANVGAWLRLAEERGLRVRWWRLNSDTERLELADLQPLLSERTRLVCCPHVSNVLGEIADVPAIARLVHAVGARLLVDGVAYAPHRQVDVGALGAEQHQPPLYWRR